MTHLFQTVEVDRLDADRRELVEYFVGCGLRVTVLRYVPSGAIDIVAHEQRHPCAQVIDNLLRLHLAETATVGSMQ